MKDTLRMLDMEFTSDIESDVFHSGTVVPSTRCRSDREHNPLVSARYCRRAKAITLELAEKDDNSNRRVLPVRERHEPQRSRIQDSWSRRMSTPELPPISDSIKHSGLINNGNLTSRTNTFHNYKLKNNEIKRNSVHSDSSLQGYRGNATTSRTSSSSSQKSRGRVLSAETEKLKEKQKADSIKENTPTATKSEFPVKPTVPPRNGMPAVVVPNRCVAVPGYKRSKSKISLSQYSNNVSTPRKMTCSSESHIGLMSTDHGARKPKDVMQRNNSDNRLMDRLKNTRSSQINGKYGDKKVTPKKATTGNLNGMRKYSSTLGLNTNADRTSDGYDEDKLTIPDSDSDSESSNRILEWVLGVNEEAEPPEEPVIEYAEEPPQRDTAIRIIYEGDT